MYEYIDCPGRGPSLFRHDLLMLHNRQSHRLSLTVDRIPEKLVPRLLLQLFTLKLMCWVVMF